MKKQELIKNIKSLAREASQQWPHEEMVELPDVLREIDQLDEPEVLTQEWIDEHKENWQDLSITGYSVPEKDLQNLIVPKKEEADLETVADVIADFYKSLERVKEVLSTKVEELEE